MLIEREELICQSYQEAEKKSSWIWNGATQSGEQFLLINDGNEDKILGFCTKRFLKILCNVNCVFMDGTFFSSPKLFIQVYTLHGVYKINEKEQIIPLIYLLLPSKSKDIYIRMFQLIKRAAIDEHLIFNPTNFQIDFEAATIEAI